MQFFSGEKSLLKAVSDFFNSTECFRFVFLISLFFASLCVVEQVFFWISSLSMIWGTYLFIKKQIVEGGIKRIRYRKIIYLFLISAVFTVVIHSERNLIDNLFMIYVMGICFFFFYGLHTEKSNLRCKREIRFLLDFIVTATAVIMLVGLALLLIFPKGFDFAGYHFCIHESRFVGIIFNANVTGFYSAVAVICCHILWRMRKADKILSFRRKVFYIACTGVNLVSLFLSDSNDSLLLMTVYCSFAVFYVIFRDFDKTRIYGFLLRVTAVLLSCVVIVSSLMFFRVLTQSRVSLMITSGQSGAEISTGITANNGSVEIKDDNERKNGMVNGFGHENTNIDSGRFAVWKQSLQMFEMFPLFGIGKANIVDYGKDYIGGLKYSDFHNGLITITISYGLAGLSLFMVFAITVAKTLFKAIFRYRKKCRDDGSVLILITGFCTAYCVYSMFEIALLADYSYKVFIFWLFIGLGLNYAFKYQKQAEIEKDTVDQSVTDLPSAVENIRQKRKLKNAKKTTTNHYPLSTIL